MKHIECYAFFTVNVLKTIAKLTNIKYKAFSSFSIRKQRVLFGLNSLFFRNIFLGYILKEV